MLITNENYAYIFFEIIEKCASKKVLDAGMILKRLGSVSRGLMNREVPVNMVLDGIDFWPEIQFPVWNTVYQSIIPYDEFIIEDRQDQYDLVLFLGIRELEEKVSSEELLHWGKVLAKQVLVDVVPEVWRKEVSKDSITELRVEQDTFFLINFGE